MSFENNHNDIIVVIIQNLQSGYLLNPHHGY